FAFFFGAGVRRVLHSFPTRRSSDLDQIPKYVQQGVCDAGLIIHEGQLTYKNLGLHLVLDLGVWWKQRTGLPLPLGGNCIRRDLGDRKSTRLNSSHVKISYAVFCLKK